MSAMRDSTACSGIIADIEEMLSHSFTSLIQKNLHPPTTPKQYTFPLLKVGLETGQGAGEKNIRILLLV